jgi:hypothetical protein
MDTERFFRELTAKWSDEDCIAFLKGCRRAHLRDLCVQELLIEFDDCPTAAEVIERAHMDYLTAPSKK